MMTLENKIRHASNGGDVVLHDIHIAPCIVECTALRVEVDIIEHG